MPINKGFMLLYINSTLTRIGWSTMKIGKYTVVIEKSNTGYAGYFPDLPGCIATGSNLEELRTNLEEALKLHIEGLRKDGLK